MEEESHGLMADQKYGPRVSNPKLKIDPLPGFSLEVL